MSLRALGRALARDGQLASRLAGLAPR
jgi:hypothetical protein